MLIRTFTKIESIRPCHTPNLPTKFHPDPSTTFLDILHRDRQTNKEIERGENITSFTFSGGGKHIFHEPCTKQLDVRTVQYCMYAKNMSSTSCEHDLLPVSVLLLRGINIVSQDVSPV